MSQARTSIFERLRSAPAGKPVEAPDVAKYFRERPAPPANESPRERFIRNARSWRAEVIETTAEEWQRQLAYVVAEKKIGKLLLGRDTAISAAAIDVLPAETLRWYDEPLANIKLELFDRVDASLSTTIGGIAETGSLLLWPTVNEPRSLSLIPPIQISVLHESEIVETFLDAMQQQNWAEAMPTNALLVTGPSKTADIQRMLVYGAHGPKELVILLIAESSGDHT
jgi:L-lactate dehydrogenase complex protein LldG